jgi:hypothetical protein
MSLKLYLGLDVGRTIRAPIGEQGNIRCSSGCCGVKSLARRLDEITNGLKSARRVPSDWRGIGWAGLRTTG